MISKLLMPVRLILISGVLCAMFTACKTTDPLTPGDRPSDNSAIIPAKGQIYRYKITESDGSQTETSTRVTSVKDSAGLSVSHIEHVIAGGGEELVTYSKAYSQNGFTTNEINLPPSLTNLLAQLGEVGEVEEFFLTGFPHFQSLENKATVGAAMTFKGDPIRLKMKLVISQEGEEFGANFEAAIDHKPGKVVGREAVTAAGQTFECAKWEYKYVMVTKISYTGMEPEVTEEIFTVNVWTAPGVGIVKSEETSVSGKSTTTLQKIDKAS